MPPPIDAVGEHQVVIVSAIVTSAFDPLRTRTAAVSSLFMSFDGVRFEALTSGDGKRRCELVQRPDGFFFYAEETFITLDEREFGGGIYDYWRPTFFSALFDTVEAAKADGVQQFPWLREASPSPLNVRFLPVPAVSASWRVAVKLTTSDEICL